MADCSDRSPDYYHTCYCLSGLSTIEHGLTRNMETGLKNAVLGGWWEIVGETGQLEPTHPVFNIALSKAMRALQKWNPDFQ